MGVRKVWQQLRREGKDVGAMAQLARLMRAVGLPTSVLPAASGVREGIASPTGLAGARLQNHRKRRGFRKFPEIP